VRGVAFTVFGGDYERGAAVLLNSLGRAGWQGRLHAFHVGDPPSWAAPLVATPELFPFPGLQVVIEPLPEPWPLCRWRVAVAQRLLPTVPAGQVLAYFDADIVVKGPIPWLGGQGPAAFTVVEDLNGQLPAAAPVRQAWARRLKAWGYPVRREWGTYVNSGFFALRPGTGSGAEDILACWSELLDRAEAAGVGLDRIKRHGEPQPEWHIVDQDLLNAALMATTAAVQVRPATEMDFGGVGTVMAHAIEAGKPWRRRFLVDALKGWPPRSVDLAYWEHAEGPALPFTMGELRRRRCALRFASWLSRHYRRH